MPCCCLERESDGCSGTGQRSESAGQTLQLTTANRGIPPNPLFRLIPSPPLVSGALFRLIPSPPLVSDARICTELGLGPLVLRQALCPSRRHTSFPSMWLSAGSPAAAIHPNQAFGIILCQLTLTLTLALTLIAVGIILCQLTLTLTLALTLIAVGIILCQLTVPSVLRLPVSPCHPPFVQS